MCALHESYYAYVLTCVSRQQNGTSAEEDNYNADIDGEGSYKYLLFTGHLIGCGKK